MYAQIDGNQEQKQELAAIVQRAIERSRRHCQECGSRQARFRFAGLALTACDLHSRGIPPSADPRLA